MKLLLVNGKQILNPLIKSLHLKGHDITIINEDAQICRTLANTFEVISVQGDGTNSSILKDAKAKNMDMVIALSDNDATNLIVCEIVKNSFSVKKTYALVNDFRNIVLFNELGVDKCVSTAQIIETIIEQESLVEHIDSYIPFENNKVSVYELLLEDSSPVLNKKLWEINFPSGSIIGCIIRTEQIIVPQGNTELKSGDKLIVISSADAIKRTKLILSGNEMLQNQ
ncbi:TrkA family potassium uptake protein [Anaerocolumna sp. AGMB13025]|uniref:potassium channel family protein n=1 Tax=Anaerocolumna sp. AGMB13025 TaxID=3039116 RepID=UPI00241C5147|nr:TrkA family potassium uptake protein [Anaerocolumna sp. AGMB13025]WFR60052.1 TrkA family potassium uptake protein [Anaerocolumna sp. AGMB13025]